MRSLGAELIEHGRDFDDAKEQAALIATKRDLEYAPSFHRDFVVGVATYAFELFTAVVDLDTVFVPIGLGSGICGVIGTRDLLGLRTKIVGVVAEGANTYSLSVPSKPMMPRLANPCVRIITTPSQTYSSSPRSALKCCVY